MKISVIICTSNRPAGLGTLLRALLDQQRLPDQIVIVEDRQGPQPTKRINALKDRGVKVIYLHRSPPSLTASRNLALKNAHGDLFSFLDDDTVPASDYLHTIEQVFNVDTTGRLAALAPVLTPWEHQPTLGDRLWPLLMRFAGFWSLPYRRRQQIFSTAVSFRFGLSPCAYLPGAAMTYRRTALRGICFDENLKGYALGEDMDFSFSLSKPWQLYRSTALRIAHKYDPLHRPNRFAWSKMLVRNLLYITSRHAGLRIGTIVVLLWQVISLSLVHLFFSLFGDRTAHLSYLAGILLGLPQAITNLYRTHSSAKLSKTAHAQPRPAKLPLPRRKNILFILNTLVGGGAERMTLTLLKNLNPDRFNTSLLCLQQPGPLAAQLPSRVCFHHSFSRHKFDLSVLPALLRLILSSRIDILVSVGNGGDRMFLSSLASLLTGRPLLIWCHSQPTSANPTFERSNRLLKTVPRAFIAVSSNQARALHELLHIPRSRIHLIENALPAAPPSARKPSPSRRASFRRQLNLPPQAFLIATVASLRPVKGHDVLIDAVAEVLPRCPNAYFLLIGNGSERQAIRDHISRLSLDSDRIQFLGSQPDVPDLLRNCDLFVLPSHSESFSLALLEAMAVGLPVIATATSGPRSLIAPGRTGLLTPVGQPHQLAQAIINLHENPERRNALASQARIFASQPRFSPETMTRAFENLLQLLS